MKKILLFVSMLLCHSTFTLAQQYSLQQLQDSALQNNAAIHAAHHDIRAAQQQRKEAFTKFFPSVSATGLWFNANKGMAEMQIDPNEIISSANLPLDQIPASTMTMLSTMLSPEVLASLSSLTAPMSVSMLKNGTIAGVLAVQPVFAGGQIVNGNKLARVGEDVSRLKLQLSTNEVTKTTSLYYWQLVSLQEKMLTVKAVEALLDDIVKDVTVAVRAGVAVRNDLLQVQLRQNDVRSQQLKLQNACSLVKMMLAHHCGLRDTLFTVSSAITDESTVLLPSPFAASVQGETALPLLPEYRLLEKQVEATKLQRRMEVGKRLPSLGVGAGYNYHNLMERSFLDASKGKIDRTFGMVFASVSVPLSDWWGGSHAIKRRKIEQLKAQEQLTDNAQLLKIRMQKAWNDVQEAFQQVALARQGVEQAEENLRLNRDFYKAGTCTMNDLLQAQLLYQQARDKRTDAFAAYQNSLLDYHQAVGRSNFL